MTAPICNKLFNIFRKMVEQARGEDCEKAKAEKRKNGPEKLKS